MVTKNQVPNNHTERVLGIAQVLAVFLLWYRVPNVYLYPYNGKIIYEWILRIYVVKLVP